VLAVNASVYNEDNLKLWLDNRQSRFLSPSVEVRGEVDGVDEAVGVVYELRVSLSSYLLLLRSFSVRIGHGSANYDERKTLASRCDC
jgi:hypothetical protein